VRALLAGLLVFFACATPSWAGGPFMMVGAAEDVVKAEDYAFAKAEMDKLKLAGFDTIRVTQTWTKGQKKLGPNDAITLGNALKAAQFTGVRVVLEDVLEPRWHQGPCVPKFGSGVMVEDFLLRMGRLDIGERLVNDIDVRNLWIFYSSTCKPRWNDL